MLVPRRVRAWMQRVIDGSLRGAILMALLLGLVVGALYGTVDGLFGDDHPALRGLIFGAVMAGVFAWSNVRSRRRV